MADRAQNRKTLAEAILDASEASIDFDDIGFALMLLPNRRLPKDMIFSNRYLGRKWTFTPMASPISQTHDRAGVPYGAVGRVIAFRLLEEAALKGSPWVELGESWMDWFSRCGFLSQNAKCARAVEEQTIRTVSIDWMTSIEGMDTYSFSRIPFVSEFAWGRPRHPWAAQVRLHDVLFGRLVKEPMPVQLRAIQKLMPSGQAMQLYIWLAYCLRNLKRPILIPWGNLFAQFDGGLADRATWRRHFLWNLEAVKTVYGAAKLEATALGLRLFPSPSPRDRPTSFRLIPA
jgi:hypothetical protein